MQAAIDGVAYTGDEATDAALVQTAINNYVASIAAANPDMTPTAVANIVAAALSNVSAPAGVTGSNAAVSQAVAAIQQQISSDPAAYGTQGNPTGATGGTPTGGTGGYTGFTTGTTGGAPTNAGGSGGNTGNSI